MGLNHIVFLAANKDELFKMITADAEKIINTNNECVPPAFVFQSALTLVVFDSYFKDTLRAGPSKTDKAPKIWGH